jgi:hypothetical protein
MHVSQECWFDYENAGRDREATALTAWLSEALDGRSRETRHATMTKVSRRIESCSCSSS